MVLHPQARAAVEAAADRAARCGRPASTSPPPAPATARPPWPGRARTSPRSPTSTPTGCAAGSTGPTGALDGTIVHLHGGGFVFNDIDVHDAAARMLANRAGIAVLSVDYRRPPSTASRPRPTTSTRCSRWLARSAAGPTYAHGDSAGGNLALVAALRHPGRFAALALTYPFLDPTAAFDSYPPRPTASGRRRPRGTGSSTPRPRPT